MNSLIQALLVALLLLPVGAAAQDDAGPFAQGSVRLSLIAGFAEVDGKSSFIGGAGLGYYLIDGLEVGAEGEYWFASDPSLSKFSPNVRYVLYFVPVLKPYVGALYRHTFVGGRFDDLDSLGGRAGAFWVSGGGSFFGGGVLYETAVRGCSEDCTQVLPELILSFSF